MTADRPGSAPVKDRVVFSACSSCHTPGRPTRSAVSEQLPATSGRKISTLTCGLLDSPWSMGCLPSPTDIHTQPDCGFIRRPDQYSPWTRLGLTTCTIPHRQRGDQPPLWTSCWPLDMYTPCGPPAFRLMGWRDQKPWTGGIPPTGENRICAILSGSAGKGLESLMVVSYLRCPFVVPSGNPRLKIAELLANHISVRYPTLV